MSYAIALARAQEMKTSLLDHGVGAVSIELQTGRNGGWYSTTFQCVLSHHTVSTPANGPTPVLALCKSGRVDVPGPLCNGYGGYDRVYRIICMEWANHSGEGGPWTTGGVTIPYNNGRPYIWGTEYEGGILPFTDEMHEFMSRANAGLIDIPWISNGNPDRHGEHKTWAPTRKIDRLYYSTQSGRDRLIPYLGAQEDDMFDAADRARLIAVEKMLMSGFGSGRNTVANILSLGQQDVNRDNLNAAIEAARDAATAEELTLIKANLAALVEKLGADPA